MHSLREYTAVIPLRKHTVRAGGGSTSPPQYRHSRKKILLVQKKILLVQKENLEQKTGTPGPKSWGHIIVGKNVTYLNYFGINFFFQLPFPG